MTEVCNDVLGKYAQQEGEKVCQVISWLLALCMFRMDLKPVIKNIYEN